MGNQRTSRKSWYSSLHRSFQSFLVKMKSLQSILVIPLVSQCIFSLTWYWHLIRALALIGCDNWVQDQKTSTEEKVSSKWKAVIYFWKFSPIFSFYVESIKLPLWWKVKWKPILSWSICVFDFFRHCWQVLISF